MVSWGMGHNLEKNLERARSLRAQGQLDRALKALQEWAEKHPDTPHYQFEAAMVAFEIRDWSTGLGALRSLMRSTKKPDRRVARSQQALQEALVQLVLEKATPRRLSPTSSSERTWAVRVRPIRRSACPADAPSCTGSERVVSCPGAQFGMRARLKVR
jgi:hypothetical protein